MSEIPRLSECDVTAILSSPKCEKSLLIPKRPEQREKPLLIPTRPPCNHLRATHEPLTVSLLHWRAGSVRSFTTIRKQAGLSCGSCPRKGEVFAYGGLSQNLKDLKQSTDSTRSDFGISLSEKKSDFLLNRLSQTFQGVVPGSKTQTLNSAAGRGKFPTLNPKRYV